MFLVGNNSYFFFLRHLNHPPRAPTVAPKPAPTPAPTIVPAIGTMLPKITPTLAPNRAPSLAAFDILPFKRSVSSVSTMMGYFSKQSAIGGSDVIGGLGDDGAL